MEWTIEILTLVSMGLTSYVSAQYLKSSEVLANRYKPFNTSIYNNEALRVLRYCSYCGNKKEGKECKGCGARH